MTHLATPHVPVSWGELLDKITILEIKRERIARAEARANVLREHRLLSAIGGAVLDQEEIALLFAALKQVNAQLWEIEDAIREQEAQGRFGGTFVRLARSVYKKNDERAAIKREINAALASEIVEEKSYADWQAAARPVVTGISATAR